MTPPPAGMEAGPEAAQTQWPVPAGIFALVLVAAVAFRTTSESLVAAWTDTGSHTYTHGFLVLAVAGWLAWSRIRRLPAGLDSPCWWALFPLLATSVVLVVFARAGIQIGHQVLLPLAAWLAILAAFGSRMGRATGFAMAYLGFAIPIWSHANDFLREATVLAVQVMLKAVGVPAYFHGNSVEIPSGLFEIEDGCSGLHFLIVALALAALLGELQDDRASRRIRHLALAMLLAIVANWVRVFTIIVAGHLTEMQHFLVRVDHYYFGWAVFAVAMVVFFRLSPARERRMETRRFHQEKPSRGSGAILAGGLASSVSLALVPAWMHAIDRQGTSAAFQIELPSGAGSGDRVENPGDWRPVHEGADRRVMSTYLVDGIPVDIYVAAFGEQRQGKELAGYDDSVIAPFVEESVRRTSVAGIEVVEHHVADGQGRRWLIWNYYQVGRSRFASGVASQLWYGLMSLRGPLPAGVVAVRAACAAECDGAGRAGQSVLGTLDPIRAPGSFRMEH